jgi:hypothetical protein
MKELKVDYFLNDGSVSRSTFEKWKPVPDLHCPRCGEKKVWVTNLSDYYIAEQHLCAGCGGSFYMPGGVVDPRTKQTEQRLAAIRSYDGQTQAPTGAPPCCPRPD